MASFRKSHSALGMIEDTIQKPLEDELAIPNNLELRLKKPGMLLNDLRSAVQRVSRLALQDTEVTLVDVTEGGRGPKTTRAGSVRDWMSQFDAQVESLRLETGSIRHLPRPEGSADAMTRHRYLDNAG